MGFCVRRRSRCLLYLALASVLLFGYTGMQQSAYFGPRQPRDRRRTAAVGDRDLDPVEAPQGQSDVLNDFEINNDDVIVRKKPFPPKPAPVLPDAAPVADVGVLGRDTLNVGPAARLREERGAGEEVRDDARGNGRDEGVAVGAEGDAADKAARLPRRMNERVEFDSPVGLGPGRELAPFAPRAPDAMDEALAKLPVGTRTREIGNQVENPSFEEPLANNKRISTRGWWTDGKTWETVDCGAGMPCPGRSLAVQCSPQFIRGAYQFLPVQNDVAAGMEVAAQISGRQMTSALPQSRSLFGMLVIVTYASGEYETHRLGVDQETFESTGGNVSQMVEARIAFRIGEVVSSILLMLTCFGYKGNAWFDEVRVTPTIHTSAGTALSLRQYVNDPPDPFPVARKGKLFERTLFNADLNRTFHEFETGGDGTTRAGKPERMVTLLSHASLDRFDSLLLAFSEWDGPVSVALYATRGVKDGPDGPKYRDEWAVAEETRRRLSADSKFLALAHRTTVVLVVGEENDEYPINRLRNAARRNVKTGFVLLADADFVPSPRSGRAFREALNALREVRQTAGEEGREDWIDKTAFVVPAFEPAMLPRGKLGAYAKNVPADIAWPGGKNVAPALMPADFPRTKAALSEHMRGGRVQQFQFKQKADAHGATNYDQWMLSSDPYVIDFDRPDYNVYNYEPYVIVRVTPTLPEYDERFAGFGMNKVSFLIELSAAGYTFTVLPNNWLIHVPHAETPLLADFQTDIEKRALNRVRRYEFLSNLLGKYRPRSRIDTERLKDLPDNILAALNRNA